jgi:hypothetical protein
VDLTLAACHADLLAVPPSRSEESPVVAESAGDAGEAASGASTGSRSAFDATIFRTAAVLIAAFGAADFSTPACGWMALKARAADTASFDARAVGLDAIAWTALGLAALRLASFVAAEFGITARAETALGAGAGDRTDLDPVPPLVPTGEPIPPGLSAAGPAKPASIAAEGRTDRRASNAGRAFFRASVLWALSLCTAGSLATSSATGFPRRGASFRVDGLGDISGRAAGPPPKCCAKPSEGRTTVGVPWRSRLRALDPLILEKADRSLVAAVILP